MQQSTPLAICRSAGAREGSFWAMVPPMGLRQRPKGGGCCPMGVDAPSGALHHDLHNNPQPLGERIDCCCDFCGGLAPGVSSFAVLSSPDVFCGKVPF